MAQPSPTPVKRSRIIELDLLRGFFIFVIIVDHAQRWPSPLTALTGQGRLWVSAAEGFFIISGLLVGYLRGYRQLGVPFAAIRNSLLRRAFILYVSAVVITFIGTALLYLLPGNQTYVPKLPDAQLDLPAYLWQVLTQQYVFEWIYFLRLYWMMLLVAPLAIYAYRTRYWWAVPVVSTVIYGFSFLGNPPEGALQWQLLFFWAATIGFKFETILAWLKAHVWAKVIAARSLVSITLVTMLLSYFWVLGWGYVESEYTSFSRDAYVSTRSWLDPVFAKYPLMPGRVVLAFIWFAGLLILLHIFRKPVEKFVGWLLVPLGQYSLTAYCIQALAVYLFQIFVPLSSNRWYNLFASLGIVLVVWALLKSRWVRAVFPK